MGCALLFCLANIYFNAGVGYVITPPNHIEPWMFQIRNNMPVIGLTGVRLYDMNQSANPMARVSIGEEWEPSTKIRIAFEISHESWAGTRKDHGLTGAWLQVKAYPWRK